MSYQKQKNVNMFLRFLGITAKLKELSYVNYGQFRIEVINKKHRLFIIKISRSTVLQKILWIIYIQSIKRKNSGIEILKHQSSPIKNNNKIQLAKATWDIH